MIPTPRIIRQRCYQLHLDSESGRAALLTATGELLFEFPLDVRIELADGGALSLPAPVSIEQAGTRVVVRPVTPARGCARQELIFEPGEDSFTVAYRLVVADGASFRPGRIEYFRDAEVGMRLNPMRRGFHMHPWGLSEEDYFNLFPQPTLRGQTTPPALCIGMEFAAGWVGVGLMDFTDGTSFGVAHPRMGLLVDAKGGQVEWRGGDTYEGPRVVFYFPRDGWDVVARFRQLLEADRQVAKPPAARPAWWKRPAYCTYGDQIMAMQPALYTCAYWDHPHYTQAWAERAVRLAEERLGWREFTVVLDAFWQRAWDPDPTPDPVRFPRLRQLVERWHDRGHRVLLWYQPHAVDAGKADYGALAQQFGVVGRYVEPELPALGQPPLRFLDYTAPQAEAYLREVARRLFSDDPDALNADGVKLDFLFFVPPSEQGAGYLRAEAGMGMRMARRYLESFSQAARAIKPDVMLNYSANDPRVAHLFDSYRLHDTRVTYQERERRARVGLSACPDLLVDSDGAVMFEHWLIPTYIAAAIYSTPTLYYADVLNDGRRVSDADMRTLGALFETCARRRWGRPRFHAFGHWTLHDPASDAVLGESYDGAFCWLATEPGIVEAIGFRDQHRTICLHGQKPVGVEPLPDNLRIEGDRLTAHWRGGQRYVVRMPE